MLSLSPSLSLPPSHAYHALVTLELDECVGRVSLCVLHDLQDANQGSAFDAAQTVVTTRFPFHCEDVGIVIFSKNSVIEQKSFTLSFFLLQRHATVKLILDR